jgi:two-component system NtrC family response regulator
LKHDPYLKIVLITGNDDDHYALRAVAQGAADFFAKPVDLDELRILLRRVLALGRLERRNAEQLRRLGDQQRLGALVGRSAEMRTVFSKIEKAASADVAVLILGESGTGKELVAKEIHRLSTRAAKPLVSINCGAIPESLVASELFGHEKGAFTGAHAARPGRLEMAQQGIVFLDEIGELPVPLQVTMLRFLQEHQIERVGGRDTIDLDVRVIAASSRDLEQEIALGRFRQDLYYRLSVVDLHLPPLRERREDILLLAQFFLDRCSIQFGRGPLALTSRAQFAIQQHAWPGNVRELEHRMQKAALMAAGAKIDTPDLELGEDRATAEVTPLREARLETDRQVIQEALQVSRGNISKAAKLLGISRPSLHTLLGKLEINAQDYKGGKSQE